MCGINGFLTSVDSNELNLVGILSDCTDKLVHRGPDSGGYWYDEKSGIYLGHRRLSIVDLSPNGSQPMLSFWKRYTICLNGEVYNHLDLRKELFEDSRKIEWNGSSDTETLLNCFESWGIETTLKKTIGMFAFALWDSHKLELTLGRDRFGEKPLYYGWQNGTFFFSSELKSIKSNLLFKSEVDRNALGYYLKYSYIPTPYSIYEDIFKLLPGSYITVSLNSKNTQPTIYWSSSEVMYDGYNRPFQGAKEQAVELLNEVLKEAVQKQMMADVSLGAFLSGGVDSSLVVAIMQSLSVSPIKTFTIGFKEDGYNEASHARKVAEYIGTDHTELYISEEDALEVIQNLPAIYDEPFADSSQIPTFLVSRLASESVTVSLSGDGADELFGGYNRYIISKKLWGKISIFPMRLRRFVSKLLLTIKPEAYDCLFNLLFFTPLKDWNVGDKIHKGMSVLTSSNHNELYDRLTSYWYDYSNIIVMKDSIDSLPDNSPKEINEFDHISKMMAKDLLTYLPDDILCKVDRAAMANSLETRVPFLDHGVMRLAWKLPLNFKLNRGNSKLVLKELLYRYVPKRLVDRPKKGFGVPIGVWLRGDLRDWAEELLNQERLLQEGFFNPEPIRQIWEEHLSGKRNWQNKLWVILMFQLWLEKTNK